MKHSYSGIKNSILQILYIIIFVILSFQCSEKQSFNEAKTYKIIPGSGNWPSFRGEYASGVADGQDLPDNWDAKSGVNIKWKTLIPGLAHSTRALAE